MQTLLKHPYTIAGASLIIGILLLVTILKTGGETSIASAAKITDPEAKVLLEQVDRASRAWQTMDTEAKPLREKLATIEADQTKLAGGNSGRLYTLCIQYGVLYVRGQDGKQGSTKEATPADCAPLQ